MGVHDYICFIQRNGQCLYILRETDETEDDDDDDECGSNEAIIVLVPKSNKITDILSWNLQKFAEFEKIEEKYSWDDWAFENFDDYRDYLCKDNWWEQTIWEDQKIPGMYLVTFEPNAYDAFVLGKISPENISRSYYEKVLENRGLDMPKNKIDVYNYLVKCGDENLAEYRNFRLSFDVGDFQTSTMNKKYMYKFTAPINLEKTRLAVLIQDNIRSNDSFFVPYSCFVVASDTIMVTFVPTLKIHIDDDVINGCLICHKRRLRTKYVCLDHIFNSFDIHEHIEMLNALNVKIMENVELLSKQSIPCTLFASFYERGQNFDIVFDNIG